LCVRNHEVNADAGARSLPRAKSKGLAFETWATRSINAHSSGHPAKVNLTHWSQRRFR